MNHGTRDRIHPKQGALNPPFQTDPQAKPLPTGRDSGLTSMLVSDENHDKIQTAGCGLRRGSDAAAYRQRHARSG